MDKLKKSLVAAVTSSIALVCMLMVFVLSATKEVRSEIGTIIVFFALLGLTAGLIVHWVKYLKQYVDFAIEQKLSEHNKEAED
jgi:riboflavin transporter FmnP